MGVEALVRTACNSNEIRIKYLLNSHLVHYRYISVLVDVVGSPVNVTHALLRLCALWLTSPSIICLSQQCTFSWVWWCLFNRYWAHEKAGEKKLYVQPGEESLSGHTVCCQITSVPTQTSQSCALHLLYCYISFFLSHPNTFCNNFFSDVSIVYLCKLQWCNEIMDHFLAARTVSYTSITSLCYLAPND
jgi:hypothetical protein